jgi:hypothetical protein
MTQYEDLIAPRRGWLSRLLAPEANARPAASAFVVGALGAAAFVASLALEWQSVSLPRDLGVTEQSLVLTYSYNAISPASLGLVYAVGVVALLILVGAVINRAEMALRLRMAVAGLTVGLLGVVVGITVGLPNQMTSQYGPGGQKPPDVTISYHPGLLFAYAAVVLPIVAIWLASRPAVREELRRDTAERTAQPVEDDENAQVRRGPAWRPNARGPLDLTVTPER